MTEPEINPAEVKRLVELSCRYFDGIMTPEIVQELNQMLRNHSWARDWFIQTGQQHLMVKDVLTSRFKVRETQSLLAELLEIEASASTEPVDLTEQLLLRSRVKNQKFIDQTPEAAPQPAAPARIIVIPKPLFWIGIAAAVTIAGAGLFQIFGSGTPTPGNNQNNQSAGSNPMPTVVDRAPSPVATIINSSNPQGLTGFTPAGELLAQQTLTILSGIVEVEFAKGARVVIEGPAEFQASGPNSMRLASGRVSANVPESAHGFMVQTPDGIVTDLGTEFGVDMRLGLGLTAVVFDGLVELASYDKATRIELTEAQAAQVQAGRPIARINDSISQIQSRFCRSIDELIYEPTVFGDAVYWRNSMDYIIEGALEDGNRAVVLLEAKNVEIDGGVLVDANDSGYMPAKPRYEPMPLTKSPAPVRVDSYLLHFDPIDDRRATHKVITGEIRFKRPVLGLVWTDDRLESTSRALSLQDNLPPNTIRGGMDDFGKDTFLDSLELSPDRQTLRFVIMAYSTDWANDRESIRILVQSP